MLFSLLISFYLLHSQTRLILLSFTKLCINRSRPLPNNHKTLQRANNSHNPTSIPRQPTGADSAPNGVQIPRHRRRNGSTCRARTGSEPIDLPKNAPAWCSLFDEDQEERIRYYLQEIADCEAEINAGEKEA